MSVFADFEECAAKTIGRVGISAKAYYSPSQCCQLLAHGCQKSDIDLKFKLRGRIDTFLICLKFGDEMISSLDKVLLGGVPKTFEMSVTLDLYLRGE